MARSFNGTTDKIVTANGVTLSAGTVVAWIQPASVSINGTIVTTVNSNSTVPLALYVKSTGHMKYNAEDNNGTFVAVDPGTGLLSAGTWYHVGLTYDKNNSPNMACFLSGASDGTAAGGNIILNSGSPQEVDFGFSSIFGGNVYQGNTADIAIWNVALIASEMAALAKGARPNTIRPRALVGWWPLDGLQSPEPDLSGAANNGTLTGTALAPGPPVMQFTPRWPQFIPGPAVTFSAAWASGKNIVVEGVAT